MFDDDDGLKTTGNDILYGGVGNDLFILSHEQSGNDLLSGGAGFDQLFLTDVFESGVTGFHINRLMLDTSASIEALVLDTRVSDHVEGTASRDMLNLSAALLALYDGSTVQSSAIEFRLLTGNDSFTGGLGNETVRIRDGKDVILLGAGDDRLILADGIIAGDTYAAGTGWDVMQLGDESSDGGVFKIAAFKLGVSSGFEELQIIGTLMGTDGKDVWDWTGLSAIKSDFTQNLGLGNDWFSISGRAVAAHIDGGAGNDSLYGGTESDFLSGGTGNDSLSGGAGFDTLSLDDWTKGDKIFGGAGHDSFRADGAWIGFMGVMARMSSASILRHWMASKIKPTAALVTICTSSQMRPILLRPFRSASTKTRAVELTRSSLNLAARHCPRTLKTR